MSQCEINASAREPSLNILVAGKDVAARFLGEEMRRTIGDGAVLIDVAMMRCSLVRSGDISHFVVSGFEDVSSEAFAREQLKDLTALAKKCKAALILVIKGSHAIDLLGLGPENVDTMVLIDGQAQPDGSFTCAAGQHPLIQATLHEIYLMLTKQGPASAGMAAGLGKVPRSDLSIVEKFKSPAVQNDFGWFVSTVTMCLMLGLVCTDDWLSAWLAFVSATVINCAPFARMGKGYSGFAEGFERGALQFALALVPTFLSSQVMAFLYGAAA